jgi:hypothetical protein
MAAVHHVAFVVLLVGALASGMAQGHDLWLIPATDAKVGQPLEVLASSGSEFPTSEHAPDTASFRRRLLVWPDGSEDELDAKGTKGNSGLLRFTPATPGTYVVAVETRPKLITLEADKFNSYLVSDGLPHIFALRAREHTLDQPGCERYSKSPKALVRVGSGDEGDPCRVVGLPLEIVPRQDPFALRVGDTLRVQVLFHGEPLAEANLGWDLPDDGEAPSGTVRTDAEGEALVPIARDGLMTIRLTHMTRPKADDCEWESFWTTLSFRLGE